MAAEAPYIPNPFTLGRQALAIPEGFKQGRAGDGGMLGGLSGALQAFQNPVPFEQDQRRRGVVESSKSQVESIMSQAESAQSAQELGVAMGGFQRMQLELAKQGVDSPEEFQLIVGPVEQALATATRRIIGGAKTPEDMERAKISLGGREGGGGLSEILGRDLAAATSKARQGQIEAQTETEEQLRPGRVDLLESQVGATDALGNFRAAGGARGAAGVGAGTGENKPIDFQRALNVSNSYLKDQQNTSNIDAPAPGDLPKVMGPVLTELNRMAAMQGMAPNFALVKRSDGLFYIGNQDEAPAGGETEQYPPAQPSPHPTTEGARQAPPRALGAASSEPEVPATAIAPPDQMGGTNSQPAGDIVEALPQGWDEDLMNPSGTLDFTHVTDWYTKRLGDPRLGKIAAKRKLEELKQRKLKQMGGAGPTPTPLIGNGR